MVRLKTEEDERRERIRDTVVAITLIAMVVTLVVLGLAAFSQAF